MLTGPAPIRIGTGPVRLYVACQNRDWARLRMPLPSDPYLKTCVLPRNHLASHCGLRQSYESGNLFFERNSRKLLMPNGRH